MSVDQTQNEIQSQNGGSTKLTAAQKRRQKRKQKKSTVQDGLGEEQDVKVEENGKSIDDGYTIEYVAAPIDFDIFEQGNEAQKAEIDQQLEDDEQMEDEDFVGMGLGSGASRVLDNGQVDALDDLNLKAKENAIEDLRRVFEKFYTPQQLLQKVLLDEEEDDLDGNIKNNNKKNNKKGQDKGEDDSSDEDRDDDDEDDSAIKNQAKKRNQRINIAALKTFCAKPEVVEVWDTTAHDPTLLTFLKAYRNTVPVPRHWSQKRKYLQGKRGIEKPPFALPEFIERTGISELRNVYSDKEDTKKLKQKQREKMQPKMNKLDIAPEILIDAFFKHQTIPSLTSLGDLYYEGKEFESKQKDQKPGQLSDDLKRALGMIENAPPPWLVNMQRYGPPPSYPYLKISGLNAPIPVGAKFGYQPGAWGKPPVNESGDPLYGDVFGEAKEEDEDKVDKEAQEDLVGKHWGEEMEEGADELEEEEEEEAESEDEDQQVRQGTESIQAGINSSIQTGLITQEAFNLRKQVGTQSVDTPSQQPYLYRVLEQQKVSQQGNLMGGDHVYVMPDQNKRPAGDKVGGPESEVQLAIDPEVLEDYQQDPKALQALYEQQELLQKEQSGIQSAQGGFIDMVAQHTAQQKRKMQEWKDKQQNKKQKQQQQQFKF